MQFFQQSLTLSAYPRGFHLITREVEQAIPDYKRIMQGMLHVFIQHTSASLSINENADPSVRHDFKTVFDSLVPENAPYYTHTQEGADDMPAHIKSALLGTDLHIPITQGRLNLGLWQGIYLCEHRNNAGKRRLIISAYGM